MKFLDTCALFFLILTTSVLTAAEESTRNGFYLSGGMGLHYTNLDTLLDGDNYKTQSYVDLITSVKIGLYVASKFALYWQREANWFESDSVIYTSELNGVGGTIYLKDNRYFEIGMGTGILTDTDNLQNDPVTGSAILAGTGFEVNKNTQLGFQYMGIRLDDNFISGASYNTFSAAFKIEFKL
jgi:hypothetical protein